MIRAASLLVALAACSSGSGHRNERPSPGSGTGVAPGSADELPVLAPARPLPAPPPGLPPLPDGTPPTPEQVALGEWLFFDGRLAADGKTACATCHDPDRDWSGAGRQPTGSGTPSLRRALALSNVAWRGNLGWDGRYKSLDGQLGVHVKGQLAIDPIDAVAKIATLPLYRAQFQRAFGAAPDGGRMITALAAFVRTRYTAPAPWDTLEAAKRAPGAPEPPEVKGYKLFAGKAQCGVCHPPPLYTDHDYHRLGLIKVGDDGRGAVDPVKRGAFRTPSLRGAAARASFFHDGSATSLDAAIDWHLAGGTGHGADRSIVDLPAIVLTPAERRDLGAFVRALTDTAAPPYARPVLPQ